ncbi:Endoplasmic reticulum vesicle protein 25 [Neolecta irregularis DAH-3]|uniref:Endoplasmic reticulum vesicle protein 25 n=1 Tax=Neolecta irregularis (strain DAH-3) TaxID=1198029 RepID=A0A1U7LN29_NEOID|nr:Endoplasmic reticulum vesicle protein 25 [Neolecta irregularis DAH-3]|eukprot:OLL23993.1 Endoplasmic reticulum vesicle protein 25 [Neolecta irregularis DAH-3]
MLLQVFAGLLLLTSPSIALKFSISSFPESSASSYQKCISNFVSADTLVVVTAIVTGSKGDGQRVNIEIKDMQGNQYGKPRDAIGEVRMAFTTHDASSMDVCFENIAIDGLPGKSRDIELDVEIGADAMDWAAIQKAEKLKPVEVELRRREDTAQEIVDTLAYMRSRELKLRNTNESTNQRVKFFGFVSMSVLIAVGIWQVIYLRTYFKRKHLI